MGFPVLNHRVMKNSDNHKELRCTIYSSNFVICHGGQNDVTTNIYVSNTMAFSFRGMPLIQGVCPGYN